MSHSDNLFPYINRNQDIIHSYQQLFQLTPDNTDNCLSQNTLT